MNSPKLSNSVEEIKNLWKTWVMSLIIMQLLACNPSKTGDNLVADPNHQLTENKKWNPVVDHAILKTDKDIVSHSPDIKKESHDDETDYRFKKIPLFILMWYDAYSQDEGMIIINDRCNGLSFIISKDKYRIVKSIMHKGISEITNNEDEQCTKIRTIINKELWKISKVVYSKTLTQN